MVHITYRHGPKSSINNMIIYKETKFYISDDRCHDLHYVQHCFQIFYDQLKEGDIHMDQHLIWSDGCAVQFKYARDLQWMSMLHKTYNVPHIWNYFETGHCKGEHDRAGACIKTALWREEMRFTRKPHIKDAESIVQWCSTAMSNRTKVVERPVRNVWHVVDIDLYRSYSCGTIQGTHGFHLVRSPNNPLFEIWMRKLVFFCIPCSSGEWDECKCMDCVDDWDHASLAVYPCVVGM